MKLSKAHEVVINLANKMNIPRKEHRQFIMATIRSLYWRRR